MGGRAVEDDTDDCPERAPPQRLQRQGKAVSVPRVEGYPANPGYQAPAPRAEAPRAAPVAPAGPAPADDRVEISLFGRVLQAVKEYGDLNQTALHSAIKEMTRRPAGYETSFKRVLAERIQDSLEHLSDPGTDRPGVDLIR